MVRPEHCRAQLFRLLVKLQRLLELFLAKIDLPLQAQHLGQLRILPDEQRRPDLHSLLHIRQRLLPVFQLHERPCPPVPRGRVEGFGFVLVVSLALSVGGARAPGGNDAVRHLHGALEVFLAAPLDEQLHVLLQRVHGHRQVCLAQRLLRHVRGQRFHYALRHLKRLFEALGVDPPDQSQGLAQQLKLALPLPARPEVVGLFSVRHRVSSHFSLGLIQRCNACLQPMCERIILDFASSLQRLCEVHCCCSQAPFILEQVAHPLLGVGHVLVPPAELPPLDVQRLLQHNLGLLHFAQLAERLGDVAQRGCHLQMVRPEHCRAQLFRLLVKLQRLLELFLAKIDLPLQAQHLGQLRILPDEQRRPDLHSLLHIRQRLLPVFQLHERPCPPVPRGRDIQVEVLVPAGRPHLTGIRPRVAANGIGAHHLRHIPLALGLGLVDDGEDAVCHLHRALEVVLAVSLDEQLRVLLQRVHHHSLVCIPELLPMRAEPSHVDGQRINYSLRHRHRVCVAHSAPLDEL